jgi:hypothetical protein
MSLSDFLFGSIEKNAERELLSYNPRTGQREKDLGDYLGDFFLRTGSELDKATKDAYVRNLEDNYGTNIRRYGNVVGGEDVSNLSSLSAEQLNRRLLANKELKSARSQAGAETGRDITEFQNLNTAEAVRARASKLIKDELDEKVRKKETKEKSRYDESIRYRDDQNNLMEEIRQQTRTDQLGREKQGELNRLQDRQLSAQNNQMMMQLEYARMSQADRQRTADRRDQAIMALLSGLGNLGAAFTV